jgi:hypothetical protein
MNSNRILHGLFFCHLVIENAIKANVVNQTNEIPTINGKQIQTLKSEGNRMVLPAQRDAVYLVKTAGRTFKVIL